MTRRKTIKAPVSVTGTALHSGATVAMTLSPAAPGRGIVFRRTDLEVGLGADIPARFDRVCETRLGTVIEQGGARVGVIEHLMAACAGLGIDDLLVELDGPEPPILNGDALSYMALLESAGVAEQDAPRTAIRVVKPVTVAQGEARASLLPAETPSYFYALDYPGIARQEMDFVFTRANFRREIAPARTFGFLSELEALRKMNLARGASLENTLALDESGVVNRDRQRFPDEFVRHKILDAIGDMALAGALLLARFEGHKSGHATNNALLRALFADPGQFEVAEL
ncbi:MAG TPA: UDP-3-O-acyl-N-acetylglucosamine deacetylase [Rhizomicrobium sp.]|jgi:UDP-3-O-[3-hydroxymyristoyl] N-acetylglucosamine deacetylase|nr:UDP-3-O-acyl-N-acetylglucosamine deacetylase [Rhizomicrobium sp.]